MDDLITTATAWLDDQRHRHLTHDVVYARGVFQAAIRASVGQSVFEQQDEFGRLHRIETRDYIIRANDLIIAGKKTEPVAGDNIIDSSSGEALIYQVASINTEPPFRYADPHRKTLRVHTKYVGTATS